MTTTESTHATSMAESELVETLRTALRGTVIDRSHSDYDSARRVWNGLIDRHPAVIARCADTADVVEVVKVDRANRPLISVRGGGHQVAGSAVCDDGLVIDLSEMRAVHVDPGARTVRAQAGATWGEVDRATQLFGLVTPGGEVSQTGIAGLTLGGGMGVLMRAHGLSCDNLRSIEIVTADGTVRTASREEHPDLFWAARGGGRGLGVVTSFEFDVHPLGPRVATAQVLYPYADARSVVRAWRDLVPQLSDSVTPQLVLWNIPVHPVIPAELHGSKVVMVAGVHAGPAGESGSALARLARLGTPLMDMSATVDYVDVQTGFDAAFPAGERYFFKSHFLDAMNDEAIDVLLECDAHRPTTDSLIVIRTLGGTVARVSEEESAYPHRRASFNISFDAAWSDPALDAAAIGWSRSTWDALAPYATGGVYVNFAGLDHEADRTSVFGPAADRLDRIRRRYDPIGLFAAAGDMP
jgi:FAD/FMN-containing dehydrogenase